MSDKQYKVVFLAIKKKIDLLVVLLTESRKSIISMLVSILTNKIFAIIIFFILLLEDWERHLKITIYYC